MKCPIEFFSGEGLGIAHSSINFVNVLPSVGIGQAQIQAKVNVSNGNLFLTDHVCTVMELDGPLSFAFHYNSQVKDKNTYWCLNLDKKLNPATDPYSISTLSLSEGDGHITTFTKNSVNNVFYGPKDANGRVIIYYDETLNVWMHYHTAKQILETYDPATGLRLSREDRVGRKTLFHYDANQVLNTVIGASGIRYEMRYSADSTGTLLEIVEVDGAKEEVLQKHHFDQRGRLDFTQNSADGYKVSYVYLDDTGRVVYVRQTDGTEFNVGAGFEVTTDLTLTNKQEDVVLLYTIDYKSKTEVELKDPAKVKTLINMNEQKQIVRVGRTCGDRASAQTMLFTTYQYQDQQLQLITYPDTSTHQFTYTTDLALLSSETLPDAEFREYFYYISGVKPLLISEARWLVNKKVPLLTRYVYDDDWDNKKQQHCFLRFIVSPGGTVTEFRNDSLGNVDTQRVYTNDRFTIPYGVPIAPVLYQMVAWVAKLKNQAAISLQNFSYDSRGQRNSVCNFTVINPDGTGKLTDTTQLTEHVWNRYGVWIEERLRKDSVKTVKSFRQYNDSLRRLTAEIDALNNTTAMSYQDADQQITLTLANGRINASVYSSLKYTLIENDSASNNNITQTRNSQNYCSFGGPPVKTYHPDGKATFILYDTLQRPRFTLSRTGIVTETRYNDALNYQTTLQYNQTVDISKLYIGPNPGRSDYPEIVLLLRAVAKIQADPKNRINYSFLNPNQQPRFQIDANNFMTESRYDKLGRIVAVIRYAKALTADQIAILTSGGELQLPIDFSKDRVNQTYYDLDSNPIMTVDPAGYVTVNQYDLANRLIQATAYHNRIINSRDLNSDLLPTVVKNNDQDATTYYQRDPTGNVIFKVDPEGCVSFNTYYASGKLAQTRHYVNKVDPAWYANTAQPPLITTSDQDEILTFAYDDLLRTEKITSNNGRVDYKTYDKMGKITLDGSLDGNNPNSVNATDQSRQQYQYDGWSQTTAKANPFVSQYMLEHPNEVASIWANMSDRFQIDATGLMLSSKDPLNHVTFYLYDEERRPFITIDPRGSITEIMLNTFGESLGSRSYKNQIPANKLSEITGGVITPELQQYIQSLRDESLDIITSNDRNNLGQVEQKTDGEGNESVHHYNAFGQIENELLPVNTPQPSLLVSHVFDPRGLEVETTKSCDDGSITEKREYEHYLGKQTAFTNGLNHTIRTKFDRNGSLKVAINARGQEVRIIDERDGLNRVVNENNGYGAVIRHQYHQIERTDTITYPESGTTKTLKSSVLDKVVCSVNPYQQSKHWEYSPNSTQAAFQAGDQPASEQKFNLKGNLTDDKNHNKVITKTEYDDADNLKMRTLAFGEADARATIYDHNAFNQENTATNMAGIVTKTAHFKTGEIKSTVIDPGNDSRSLNISTNNVINAQGQIATQSKGVAGRPSDYDLRNLIDGFGRNTGNIVDPGGLNIQSTFKLNAIGKPTITTDPNGNKTLHFYDENECERFTIYANGAVKELRYDIMDREVKDITYAAFLTSAEMASLQSTADCERLMATKMSADDAMVWKFYNGSGALRFTVNAIGAVIEQRYDKAQRDVSHYKYANFLNDLSKLDTMTTAALEQLMTQKIDTENDRITYTIYNNADQPAYTIDEEGYITEHQFDGENNELVTSKYATQLQNPQAVAQLPVDQVPAAITRDSVHDQTSYSVYNHHNQLLFQVNAGLSVTGYGYDTVGNSTTVTQYKNQITTPSSYADLLVKLANLTTNAVDRITTKKYDHANRVWQTVDALNNTDTFDLNSLDDVEHHTDRANNKTDFIYDRARRLSDEIAPVAPIVITTQTIVNGKVQIQDTVEAIALRTHFENDNNSNQIGLTTAYNTPMASTIQQKFDSSNNMTGIVMDNIMVDNGQLSASYVDRPEKKVKLESTKIYDSKKRVVVEQAENGSYTFTVRDAAGNVRFIINDIGAVVEFKRNAFGELIEQIQYDKKLNLKLSDYIKTGVPIALVQVTASPADRHVISQPDRRGNVKTLKRGPVIDYSVTGPNPSDRQIAPNSYIMTQKAYNAFSTVVKQQDSINQKMQTSTEKLFWYDQNNKEIAVAEKCDNNGLYYLTLYRRNIFGEIEYVDEYKRKISAELDPNTTTVEQLRALGETNKDPGDRHYKYGYNLCGSKTEITKLAVTRAKLKWEENYTASIEPIIGDLSKFTEYNALQLPEKLIHEDGKIEKLFYDPLKNETARTGIARTDVDGTTLIPLKLSGFDVHQNEVKTANFANGSQNQDTPVPKNPDPTQDQITLKITDSRGLVMLEQDPEQNLKAKTYNPNKKLNREFHQVTNVNTSTLANEIHIDQKLYQLDSLDLIRELDMLRDAVVQYVWQSYRNTFGEAIKEGDLVRLYDNVGRVLMQNEKGIPEVYGYDGSGEQNLLMRSASRNLALIKAEDMLAWLQDNSIDLERTETVRDLQSNATQTFDPVQNNRVLHENTIYTNLGDTADLIPLAPVFTKQFLPTFTGACLTWIFPQERIVQPTLQIWPSKNSNVKISKPIIAVSPTRVGIDVSDLPADVYTYSIDYRLSAEGLGDTMLYHTGGQVQIDNPNHNNSLSIVVIVENDDELRLNGNTEGLTQAELMADGQVIATVPINNNRILLSNYISGVYQLKVTRGAVDDISLPFTIYTNQLPVKALCREIACKATLNTKDEYGQLLVSMPRSYIELPVKITLNYMDDTNQPQTDTVIINDVRFFDLSGPNNFAYNCKFSHKVQSVTSLDLEVTEPHQEWLNIIKEAKPLNSAQAASIKLSFPNHQINTMINHLHSMPNNHRKNDISNVDGIVVSNFAIRQVIHIESLPDMLAEPPMEYLDMTYDRLAEWRGLEIIDWTQKSVTIDITAMQPGTYPCRMVDGVDKYVFNVSGGGQVYPCNDYLSSPTINEDNYFLLAQLAPQLVEDKSLTGHLPDGSKYNFTEYSIRQDADSAFIALGIVSRDGKYFRDIFADFLASLIKAKPEVATKLHEEIFAGLMSGAVTAPHPELWQMLTTNANQQILINYAKLPSVVDHYIMQYRKNLSLGYQSALLYAACHNITLHIWQRDNQTQDIYYHCGHDAKANETNVIHALFTTGYTRFNLLVEDNIDPSYSPKRLQYLVGNRDKYLDNTRTSHKAAYDRWHNAELRADADNNITLFEYNDADCEVKRKLPLVDTYDEHNTMTKIAPVYITAYGLRGYKIFEQDPNQHTTGYVLDEAMQLCQVVDGSGTKVMTLKLNIYGDSLEYRTAYGAIWVNQFDRKRRCVASKQPDNSYIRNVYNEVDRLFKQTSTGGKLTIYNTGVNLDIIGRVDPGNRVTFFVYDKQHQILTIGLPAPYPGPYPSTGRLSWTRDYFGNELTHTNLSNMLYIIERDFKQQMKRRYQPVGSPANPQKMILLMIYFSPNPYGTALNLFEQVNGGAFVPNQNLAYFWDAGRMMSVDDLTNKLKESMGYDKLTRCISLMLRRNNTLVQLVQTQYDARSATVYSHDGMFVAKTGFDPKGNRRFSLSGLYSNGNNQPDQSQVMWNTFDGADRVLYSGADFDFIKKEIKLSQNHGILYTYLNGRRDTQKYKDASSAVPMLIKLSYFPSGLLLKTDPIPPTPGIATTHVYDDDYQRTQYTQTNPGGMKMQRLVSTNYYVSINGFSLKNESDQTQINSDTKRILSATNFSGWTGSGQPTHQETANTYVDKHNKSTTYTDVLDHSFVGLEDFNLISVGGSRSSPHRKTTVSLAQNVWNSNDSIAVQAGLVDPDNENPKRQKSVSMFHLIAPSGYPIEKTAVQYDGMFPLNPSDTAHRLRSFVDANKNVLGFYEQGLNNHNKDDGFYAAIASKAKHELNRGKTVELGFDPGRGGWTTQKDGKQFTVVDPVQPIGALWMSTYGHLLNGYENAKLGSSLQGTVAWQNNNMYTVKPGETSYAQISAELFDGDTTNAELIAQYNQRGSSFGGLVANEKLRVPMFIPAHNNYQVNMNYIRFMSVMVENLYPGFKTPQPKTNWFQVFVLVFAVVIAVIVAPVLVGKLAPEILVLLGGKLAATMIIAGLAAALVDAAGQEVLVGFGLEDRFQFDDVLEAGLAGALSAGTFSGGLFDPGAESRLLNEIIQKGMANITHQLFEMSIGKQEAFNYKCLLASVGNAVFSAQIQMPVNNSLIAASPRFAQALDRAFKEVTSSFITMAITQSPTDIRAVTAQIAGNIAGTWAGERLASYIDTLAREHEYQQYLQAQQSQRSAHQEQVRAIKLPAPVAAKVSQKQTEVKRVSQRPQSKAQNLQQRYRELNQASIHAHEAEQSQKQLLMHAYQESEKGVQNLFNSPDMQQTDSMTMLYKIMMSRVLGRGYATTSRPVSSTASQSRSRLDKATNWILQVQPYVQQTLIDAVKLPYQLFKSIAEIEGAKDMIRFSNNAEVQRSAMLTIQSKGQDLNAMYLGVKNLALGGVEFTAMSLYDMAALGNPFLREPALIDLQMRFDQISSPQVAGSIIGGAVAIGLGEFGLFAKTTSRANVDLVGYSFKPGQAQIHFERHLPQVKDILGYENYTIADYVRDANLVIKNGIYVPERHAYVAIAGGIGDAKALFVGLDRSTNHITTIHFKTISDLEKISPNLGWEARSEPRVDLIGPNRELGWKYPYEGVYHGN